MRILYLVFSCLLLSGCSLIQQQALDSAYDRDWFQLQPADSLDQQVVATQFVAFHYGDTHVTSINQLEWTRDKITIALLSHMGGALLTLLYDNKQLETEASAALPAQLHAGYLLRDYQLTYLPAAAVRAGFKASALRLEESGNQRRIFNKDTLLIHIEYASPDVWQGKAVFRNVQRGYHLAFNTIEANRLE